MSKKNKGGNMWKNSVRDSSRASRLDFMIKSIWESLMWYIFDKTVSTWHHLPTWRWWGIPQQWEQLYQQSDHWGSYHQGCWYRQATLLWLWPRCRHSFHQVYLKGNFKIWYQIDCWKILRIQGNHDVRSFEESQLHQKLLDRIWFRGELQQGCYEHEWTYDQKRNSKCLKGLH